MAAEGQGLEKNNQEVPDNAWHGGFYTRAKKTGPPAVKPVSRSLGHEDVLFELDKARLKLEFMEIKLGGLQKKAATKDIMVQTGGVALDIAKR